MACDQGEAEVAPRIGIFWQVRDKERDVLVTDSTPVDAAEPYGDCLTHPRGHYEMWSRWQRAGSGWLKQNGLPGMIVSTEYEQHPRGRIVYERRNDLFVIYADQRLQNPTTIGLILAAFRLQPERYVVRSDDHYR